MIGNDDRLRFDVGRRTSPPFGRNIVWRRGHRITRVVSSSNLIDQGQTLAWPPTGAFQANPDPISYCSQRRLLYPDVNMANRAATLDPNVFAISDLEVLGGKKLPKMYRG